MQPKNNYKKMLLVLFAYITFLFAPKDIKCDNKTPIIYNTEYQMGSDMPYATYNGKEIYITDEEHLQEIIDKNPDDICIIDGRNQSDPYLSVFDSYKIKKLKDIHAILNILLAYEQQFSSPWNRTFSSMELEWLVHNFCYYISYETERAERVDLNNSDQDNYKNVVIVIVNFNSIIEEEINGYTLSRKE